MDTTGFSPSSDCSSWSYTLSTLNAGDLTANIDLSTLCKMHLGLQVMHLTGWILQN